MYAGLIFEEKSSLLFVDNKKVTCSDSTSFYYDKLCVCTGGKPKLIAEGSPYVIGIRDTETVVSFQARLANARRVVIVGNGGIATELVYEIRDCKIVWVIRDSFMSHHFFDAHSAKFFEKKLKSKSEESKEHESDEEQPGLKIFKRAKYSISSKLFSFNIFIRR